MVEGNPNIVIEITDARELHCFRLTLNMHAAAADGEMQPVMLMLHARSLVDLIHKANRALCEWQRATTEQLIKRMHAELPAELQEQLPPLEELYAPPLEAEEDDEPSPETMRRALSVMLAAAEVASLDWRTSVTESEHNVRIAAMNRLREKLRAEVPA